METQNQLGFEPTHQHRLSGRQVRLVKITESGDAECEVVGGTLTVNAEDWPLTYRDLSVNEFDGAEPEALRAEIDRLRSLVDETGKQFLAVDPGIPWEGAIDAAMRAACDEIQRLRAEHDGACQTIAQMHEAAVGEARGPDRGVVEDVADLRTRALAAEARVAELEKAANAVAEAYQQLGVSGDLAVVAQARKAGSGLLEALDIPGEPFDVEQTMGGLGMTAPDKREEFDDGGPAFPSGTEDFGNGNAKALDAGMTLRDWFAGQFLGDHMADADRMDWDPARVAKESYRYADAMIAEKRRRQGAGGAS